LGQGGRGVGTGGAFHVWWDGPTQDPAGDGRCGAPFCTAPRFQKLAGPHTQDQAVGLLAPGKGAVVGGGPRPPPRGKSDPQNPGARGPPKARRGRLAGLVGGQLVFEAQRGGGGQRGCSEGGGRPGRPGLREGPQARANLEKVPGRGGKNPVKKGGTGHSLLETCERLSGGPKKLCQKKFPCWFRIGSGARRPRAWRGKGSLPGGGPRLPPPQPWDQTRRCRGGKQKASPLAAFAPGPRGGTKGVGGGGTHPAQKKRKGGSKKTISRPAYHLGGEDRSGGGAAVAGDSRRSRNLGWRPTGRGGTHRHFFSRSRGPAFSGGNGTRDFCATAFDSHQRLMRLVGWAGAQRRPKDLGAITGGPANPARNGGNLVQPDTRGCWQAGGKTGNFQFPRTQASSAGRVGEAQGGTFVLRDEVWSAGAGGRGKQVLPPGGGGGGRENDLGEQISLQIPSPSLVCPKEVGRNTG